MRMYQFAQARAQLSNGRGARVCRLAHARRCGRSTLDEEQERDSPMNELALLRGRRPDPSRGGLSGFLQTR